MTAIHFKRHAALADLMNVANSYDVVQAEFKKAQEALVTAMIATYNAGASHQEIADVVHVTRQRVSQILQEHHVIGPSSPTSGM